MAFWSKLLTWKENGLQWGERVTAQVIPLSEFWFISGEGPEVTFIVSAGPGPFIVSDQEDS